MTVRYEGKSPSRLWYARQKLSAFTATFGDKSTKLTAKEMGKSTALSAGSFAGGAAAFHYVIFLGVPTLLLGAGIVAGSYFGIKAFHGVSALKNSSAFSSYVKQQEKKWLEKKAKGGLMKRLAAFSAKLGSLAGYGLAASGIALASAAALELTGIIAAGTIAAAMGSVVALPAVIAIGIAAACVGAATGFACKAALPQKAQKAAAAPGENQFYKGLPNSFATPSFKKAATPAAQQPAKPEVNEREIKAAAERAAARAARRHR